MEHLAQRVAVIGATGYTGEELLRLLVRHPHTHLTYISAKDDRKARIQDLFPHLHGKLDLECPALNADEAIACCDVAFLALPHTVSMQVAPLFLRAGKKVIDMSGDYRLRDAAVYETFYKAAHRDTENLRHAVYGLPEIHRQQIAKARLLSNPGCYSTGAILGLWPALTQKWVAPHDVIIDAKSGVTGAGRKASLPLHYSEVNESIRAYKIFSHQHVPEIDQALSLSSGADVRVIFVPHLLPVNRGILSTIYVKLQNGVTVAQLQEAYDAAYASEPFVRVLPSGQLPELKQVAHTNLCTIGMAVDAARGVAVIVTAIDNLGKGAAGQAVQNYNIMCGFPETAGLA